MDEREAEQNRKLVRRAGGQWFGDQEIICRAGPYPPQFPYEPKSMRTYDNTCEGIEDRFFIGKKCFYKVSSLLDWLAERVVTGKNGGKRL